MFKVKIPKKIQIIGNLFCLVLFVSVFYQIQTRQYDDTDNLVEYAVSMHYDFKILSESENSFYNYVGMTREGKRVNFKLPKIWNLKGVKSIWTQYLYPVYVNDSLDIVIGLDKIGSSNTYAYRLSDGQLLWNAEIPMTKNVGWEHSVLVDSSHLIVVGDDVNEIDICTGKVWKVKAKTGIADTKGALMEFLVNSFSVAVLMTSPNTATVYFYHGNPMRLLG